MPTGSRAPVLLVGNDNKPLIENEMGTNPNFQFPILFLVSIEASIGRALYLFELATGRRVPQISSELVWSSSNHTKERVRH
jgi:hypothetical protein